MTVAPELSLGMKQELFAELQAQWVLWVIDHPGWKLRQGEGRILINGADGKTGRRARQLDKDGTPIGSVIKVRDLVHKPNGAHPNGLGTDWQLFVDGQYITRGDHPAWIACGVKWESLSPLCRWGGRFAGGDANHISLIHAGVA